MILGVSIGSIFNIFSPRLYNLLRLHYNIKFTVNKYNVDFLGVFLIDFRHNSAVFHLEAAQLGKLDAFFLRGLEL